MQPSKAGGSDGFHAVFYQKFVSVVGKDVNDLALKFLNCSGSLEEINQTLLVLIPKIKNATKMIDFDT